ncbi:MAG: phage head-tail connector protein [Peptostreptococcaceae bacterium]|nr:phage head-tail connector protein [Peptostreptococcaceae bacterium]
MLLNRIKTLLQINDNDELIYEIVEITKEKILNYINEKELPIELEFVLVEMAVSRFNKIGSEGFSSESIDGKSISYEDDFEMYKQYLDDYLFKTGQNKGFKLL